MNRSLFYLFFVLCALGCSKKDRTPADPKSSPSPFAVHMPKVPASYKEAHLPHIEEFYNRTWERNHTSGGFLVAKNGEILFEKYSGYGRIETESKIDRDTPLHIASMSKVLTAAVVLRLVDDGKLRLDQDVSTILNPFPYPGVTVEMLLCHRSGIPYYAWFGDDQKVWDHAKPMKNHDVLDLLNQYKFPLNFYSGRRFAYCNTNYVLLALIIEKVTGMDYPTAMKKLLFDPIGMTHTFVFNIDTDKDKVSQSYKGNKIRLAFDWTDGTCGDKNIYSTPRDLLKFDIATYAPGFLSTALKEKAWSGKSYESKGKRNYGYGMRIYEWETGQKMLYHNGWWHGNTSSYITLKKDTVTIIGIANKYSAMPWQAWKLTPSFGDYPFKVGEEEGN
ncbi:MULTISPECIES: serine hydrolase [unclassified Flavobacterium]|uniref:serine hydrolase domain-containing protein n=1 Tax=unclassified Flavobacterium TaxID=196869 RepID=UPI001F1364A8|nr:MULTISPECIES: serine hydrolase domain-containing protein [unclassified Flavobacterium]UMY64521.1 beta-lactamase family protein [Flavobacterium sp. HJ-32-4]